MTDAGGVSRRALLLGGLGAAGLLGAGTAGALSGVLPGRVAVANMVGLGGWPGAVPDVEPGVVQTGQFTSTAMRGAATGWVLAWPPDLPNGSQVLPVCLFLHGRGETARQLIEIGYHKFLAAAVHAGSRPFLLAAVDGGDDSYWHPRRRSCWPRWTAAMTPTGTRAGTALTRSA